MNKKIKSLFKEKASKGYYLLKNLPKGQYFSLSDGTEGYVIEHTSGSSLVYFTNPPIDCDPEDINYWTGRKHIAPETQVRRFNGKKKLRKKGKRRSDTK
jgi:hypothetical protein